MGMHYLPERVLRLRHRLAAVPNARHHIKHTYLYFKTIITSKLNNFVCQNGIILTLCRSTEMATTSSSSQSYLSHLQAASSVEIESDLRFSKPALENRFRLAHMATQRPLDIQFHFARAAAWLAVGSRMLLNSAAREDYLSAIITIFGALTTLAPSLAHRLIDAEIYVKYRPAVLIVDNILQVALGCFTHSAIYPEIATHWRDAAGFKAVGVTVTGNGNAWLLMSSLLGALPFRLAIMQQAILVIIMLLASRSICERSFSLQKGHNFVYSWLVGGKYSAESPVLLEDGLDVCLAGQSLSLLLIGFIFPTFYLYKRERAARARFLKALGVMHRSHIPGYVDYMTYSLPAVACMYVYIVTQA